MVSSQETAPDWAEQQADRVITFIDTVKGFTTDKVVLILRLVVFGLVAVVFAGAAILLLVIIVVRLADAYLPIGAGVGDAGWAAHLFIGSLFAVLGFGAWLSRRSSIKPLVVAGFIDLAIIVTVVCYGIVHGIIAGMQ